MPDTGSNAKSSAADDSGTPDSSPESSSTMETKDDTSDMVSSESSSSLSTSEGSMECNSTTSTPPSPRQTSIPYTEEAEPASIPSKPPSPLLADNSMQVRLFYREQTGHMLKRQKYRKCDELAQKRAAVLKQVAQ